MPVVHRITEELVPQINQLKTKGIIPKLSVVRVGEREDDLAYERGIVKRFSASQATAEVIAFPEDVAPDTLEKKLVSLTQDPTVHGILLFRPLPHHLPQDYLKDIIPAEKDVDGMSAVSHAYVYEGNKKGYTPCTAQAVIELMDHYSLNPAGKKVAIIGRSLVVGKPLSMLLLGRNATVTVCHSQTASLPDECRRADILIACAGSAKMVGQDYIRPGQIVIDVGINMAEGKLCGDTDYDSIAGQVEAITPVPGGIGTVTTSILLKNTVHSAMNTLL